MAIIVVKVWKGGSHGLHFPYWMSVGMSLIFVFKEVFTTPLGWTISSVGLTLDRKEADGDF